jgi:hypothetical protein
MKASLEFCVVGAFGRIISIIRVPLSNAVYTPRMQSQVVGTKTRPSYKYKIVFSMSGELPLNLTGLPPVAQMSSGRLMDGKIVNGAVLLPHFQPPAGIPLVTSDRHSKEALSDSLKVLVFNPKGGPKIAKEAATGD